MGSFQRDAKLMKSPDVTGNLRANWGAYLCIISIRASARSTSASAPTYFLDNICVVQLFDESHPPPPWILVHSSFVFLFVVANTPQKSQSLSSSRQTKRVVILWHLAALHQPLSTALCSFSFSSSAPSLPIIYSVLSDGPC